MQTNDNKNTDGTYC